MSEVDKRWLGNSKSRIKLSYDDARKKICIQERMKRQHQKLKDI